MLVERIMSRNPITVAPHDSLRWAIKLMKEGTFRRLPVLEDGQLVGIVTDRDIRLAANSPVILRERWQDEFLLDHVRVEACMTPDPITVTPDTDIVEAARLMRGRKVGGLPVLQGDKLVGIVTETDILNLFIELLERGACRDAEEPEGKPSLKTEHLYRLSQRTITSLREMPGWKRQGKRYRSELGDGTRSLRFD